MTIAAIAAAWMVFDTADAKAAAQRKELYMVVQVGNDVSVIPKSQLTEEKKRIAQQYKEETKSYEQAKREAVKKREKIALARPIKHTVKVLKNGLKSQQEADAWKEKFLEDREEHKHTGTKVPPR